MSSPSSWQRGGGALFRTTHWSVVLTASQKDAPGSQAALAKLCQAYWYPLYAYLRRWGYDSHEAQDLTQAFFEKLLEKSSLAGIQEGRGKFRSFLLTLLKRFVANEWARTRTRKRGGDRQIISFDHQDPETRYQAEPADPASPDQLFERRWAATLLECVMERLEAECKQWKKAELFDRLHGFLAGAASEAPYAALAARLGMSEGAVKTAVYRLRKRYGELLREEIARTVSGPEEVEGEIRHLMAVFAR